MIKTNQSIQQAVIQGNVGSITEVVKHLLEQGHTAQQILDDQLLPGMEVVGERFKRNELFLPQVLMSAQAMQTAIDILKPILIQNADSSSRKTIIIGTVKGDMHDIGKNLVRIMLVGAGFEVIDLGVNVPPQRFLEAAGAHQAPVVCLSALLSSTMNNMREVVQLFRSSGQLKNTGIMTGGASVNQQFSQAIGADAYAPSAPLAVELVRSFCQL